MTQETVKGTKPQKFTRVFVISLFFTACVGAWGLIDPEGMTGAFGGFTSYMLESLSWYWLLLTTGLLILIGYMAFGPYAHIRLGKDDERPEFSTLSWLSMLFASGMGAGLLFWGVAEPMTHFQNPPGMAGGTAQAAREAFVITNLHWGFHAWAIYGMCALVIAYFSFRRGKPATISAPITVLFSSKIGKSVGTAADVLGVLAVVFGLAGSLTMGIFQISGGLNTVFNLESSTALSLMIMAALFVSYMVSASTGLGKGIKILSQLNMLLAITLLAIVIIFGPTVFIMETFVNSIGDYFTRLPQMAFKLYPFEGLSSWMSGWTLTYLIWWLAWGPFVGVFIARISRGRTIREFCLGVVLIPTLFSVLWFSVFGGSAIYIELFGGGGISELVATDVTSALFSFLDYFPLGYVLGILACVLIFIFLVTSADSGTFVLSMLTMNGNLNPSLSHKLVWGVLIAAITTGTVLSGSVPVAMAMAIVGALPFSVFLLLQIVGFLREIRKELHDPADQNEILSTLTKEG